LRNLALPSVRYFHENLIPFLPVFCLSLVVFYIAGLYEKQTRLVKREMGMRILGAQIANVVIAALLFFALPLQIAPKTILALYLVVSLAVIFSWRTVLYPILSSRHARERAVFTARGEEAEELFAEVNGNPRYGIALTREPADARTSIVVADAAGATAWSARKGKQVVAFEDLYEEVFDRVPLSVLEQSWFRENVATEDPLSYAVAKRLVDIAGGIVMGVITIVAVPFVALALQCEYPGPVFLVQTRIGQHGTRIRAYKFRSMRFADKGAWKGEGENAVTRVGSFLRKISLDEFPQFINILKGELSLIGPRNDIEALGIRLADAIPYYMARYSVRPGITGWAQINQRYEPGNVSPQSIKETKVRLAYDFYYLKHRSFGLDIVIALKTLKRMFFRVSSF
ncbi:MAG: hypothetical protein B7X03_03180, partial [Parcubacteria group bacterium 21-58-10]